VRVPQLRAAAGLLPGARRTARYLRRRRGGPLAAHAAQLPTGSGRAVVVLAADPATRAVRRWLRPFAADDLQLLDGAVRASDVLTGRGPVDVVVDLLDGTAAEQEARWQRLFLHLRPGGSYVVAGGGSSEWVRRLRVDPAEIAPHISPSAKQQLEHELAVATGRVTSDRDVLVVRKRGHHLVKVREADLPRVLPQREPQLGFDDLLTLPAGSYEVSAEVAHHGAAAPEPWAYRHVDYPAMRLRHYAGPLTFGGRMLVHGRETILPDSYHWPLADNPDNPFTVNAGPDFARLAGKRPAREELAGDYFLLDPNYGAFGHVMTEVVGRLWGWDRAKAEYPDLKALFWSDRQDVTGNEPKYRIPRAYGIALDDIVWTRGPVGVNSLVAPSLMWHNREPFYAHPQLREVWARIGRGLIDESAPTYDRVFIGRTETYARRTCRNDVDVRRFFTDRGFTVVYPELLGLGAQAAVFARAKVIAGYGGSGLFSVLFARELEALIVLNQNSYSHRNEQLFAAVLGVPLHYFWSFADVGHPAGQRSFAATESSWAFDFEDNGAGLADLLAQL
jgi:hypothetical protein